MSRTSLFLAAAAAAALRAPPPVNRRALLGAAVAAAAPLRPLRADEPAEELPPAPPPLPGGAPTNFDLIREESAPYSQHFLQNAAQLADNLEWYTSNVDADVGRQLKAEIVEFAAQYRRDGYTPYGPMPGLPDLQTAYDALSAHFARYQSTPSGFATPLPEALVGTIERNVANARRNGRWADRAAAAAAVAASE